MKDENIVPQRFWDLYFRNQFEELERTENELKGKIRGRKGPGSVFSLNPDFQHVAVKRADLKEYSYDTDVRFTRFAAVPMSLAETIRKVIDRSYPYREPPPFGIQRMSELFVEAKRVFAWAELDLISDAAILEVVISLVSTFKEEYTQLLNSLVWLLGERREAESCSALFMVIEKSKHVSGPGPKLIHFSIVDTAFEALWKIDYKPSLKQLLELMKRCDHSGRLKAAAVFKRLLSRRQLLSLEVLGERYYSAQYWSELIRPLAIYSQTQWNVYDTEALFWEIRYLGVIRLQPKDQALKNAMYDEVSLVARLASAKLAGL